MTDFEDVLKHPGAAPPVEDPDFVFQDADVIEASPAFVEAPLPAVIELNTQGVLVHLMQYEAAVKILVEAGRAIAIIKDQETNELALTIATRLKKLRSNLEKRRHHFVDEPYKYFKAVNNFFGRLTDPMEAEEKALGRKSGAYRMVLEQERRRQQAEQDAEAEKLRKKMEEEAKASAEEGKHFELLPVLAPVVAEVPKVTRVEEGSASHRRDWTFEITDAGQVPREYCQPDEKLIRQAVKDGVREIAGVRVFEEYTTLIRT